MISDGRFKSLRIQHLILGFIHISLGILAVLLPLSENINAKVAVYAGIPSWIDCVDYNHEKFQPYKYDVVERDKVREFCVDIETSGVMFLTNIKYILLDSQWFVFAFFVWTGLAHIFYTTLYANSYKKLLDDDKCLRIRWLEYGVSAGIMIGIIAYLSGIQNMTILALLFKLFYVLISSGYYSNRLPNLAYILVGLLQLWLWIYIGLELILPHSSNLENIPWFVYLIYFGEFFLFNSFAVVFFLERRQAYEPFILETIYNVLSLCSKGFLIVLLASTIYFVSSRSS